MVKVEERGFKTLKHFVNGFEMKLKKSRIVYAAERDVIYEILDDYDPKKPVKINENPTVSNLRIFITAVRRKYPDDLFVAALENQFELRLRNKYHKYRKS